MSHTIKVKIELKDRAALTRSVTDLSGTVLGEGQHRLYAGLEEGFGFRLPEWRFPLVAKNDGELAYDNYNGRWGKVEDITLLKNRYALAVARQAAQAQGWPCQDEGEGLLVFHPDGGILTIRPDGAVDAIGFEGAGCQQASSIFASALGTTQEEVFKDEFFAERAHVVQSG